MDKGKKYATILFFIVLFLSILNLSYFLSVESESQWLSIIVIVFWPSLTVIGDIVVPPYSLFALIMLTRRTPGSRMRLAGNTLWSELFYWIGCMLLPGYIAIPGGIFSIISATAGDYRGFDLGNAIPLLIMLVASYIFWSRVNPPQKRTFILGLITIATILLNVFYSWYHLHSIFIE